MRVAAIIASGGEGRRFSSEGKKQFAEIAGKPILVHSTHPFEKSELIDEIILVVPIEDVDYVRQNILRDYQFRKVTSAVEGGAKRQDSVYRGLVNLKLKPDFVFIHDGVRPFVKVSEIERSFKTVKKYGSVVFGFPARNTIKKVDKTERIVGTPPREELWEACTPQIFMYDEILRAHEAAQRENFYATDDAALMERKGKKVKFFHCSPENIKITHPVDLKVAETIMKEWSF